jgi:hypothetical protein
MAARSISFKQAVNEALRLGFAAQKQKRARTTFKVEPIAMGALRAGLSYDSIGNLLEEADGPTHK